MKALLATLLISTALLSYISSDIAAVETTQAAVNDRFEQID